MSPDQHRIEAFGRREIFAVAASFGLLTGLVEGAGLLILQKSRWAGRTIDIFFVPPGILYVSPCVDLFLFVAAAFALAGITRLSRRLPPNQPLFFLLLFLMLFDWLMLALSWVIHPFGIAMLAAGLSAVGARVCLKRGERILQGARRALLVMGSGVALLAAVMPARNLYLERAAAASLPAGAGDQPNVLIVVMDTVRADHVSAYGYARPTTPNLDRLAREGVLFEQAYSTSSWTLPAHASLLTGRFPFEHGAERHDYDGRYTTLAEALRRRGYRTGAFSANTFYFTRQNGFGNGFIHFDDLFTSLPDVLSRPFYGRELVRLYQQAGRNDLPGRKRAEEINARFLSWRQENQRMPFFAVLNYFDAHAPYLPPAPFRGRFSSQPDPGGILNYVANRLRLQRLEDVRDENDAYDGAIDYEDDQVGRLMGALQRLQLSQNTLVLLLSDHGEFFGEHNLFMHQNALFLEGIHVPLLAYWPGHVRAGVRVKTPVSLAWVPATIMELMPDQGRGEFPGPSLVSLWGEQQVTPPTRFILSEFVPVISSRWTGDSRRVVSLLTSRWHFLLTRGKQPLLFDWLTDPGEKNDLTQTSEGQRIVTIMRACINTKFSQIREPNCGLSIAQAGELTERIPTNAAHR